MIRAAPRGHPGRRPRSLIAAAGNAGHSFAELRMFRPAFKMTERPLIAVCLARQSALAATALQRSPYIPGETYREVTSPAGRLDPAGGRVCGCPGRRPKFPRTSAPAWPPAFDRDPGWSPWPTPDIQTRMIASTAPRATSPAQSPTSPGHGWPSHLLSQRLQSRTASTVLTRSKPASNRPSAGCTRPLRTTPGDLAGLLADMESVWVLVGVAGWHRDDPKDCHRLRYRRSHSCGHPGRAARALASRSPSKPAP
jgi:hypothetical protein